MSFATEKNVLDNLQIQLYNRRALLVVPGSDIDQNVCSTVLDEAIDFYFDVHDLKLVRLIRNYDGLTSKRIPYAFTATWN